MSIIRSRQSSRLLHSLLQYVNNDNGCAGFKSLKVVNCPMLSRKCLETFVLDGQLEYEVCPVMGFDGESDPGTEDYLI